MRIVLDTNILVRALTGPGGPAAEALRSVVSPHTLSASPFLLSELTRALRYERVRRMHGKDDEGIARYVARIREQAIIIELSEGTAIQTIPHDAGDEPILLATAITGQADVLGTLDRHFQHADVRAFCAQHSLRILTDVELLTELRSTLDAGAGVRD